MGSETPWHEFVQPGDFVVCDLGEDPGEPGFGIYAIIRAKAVDAAVADAFLTALSPAELDALSRARRAQSQVDSALHANAEREVERTRYAAALAQRQFNRVDPDNRLVAAELERRWESALVEVRAAEAALAEQSAEQPTAHVTMGKAFTGKVVTLAGRLPQIWADPATTEAHRKALLRCLVDKVVLDRTPESALVRVVWRGGAVTELDVKMRVTAIAKLARGDEMRARLLKLAKAGIPDNEIARILPNVIGDDRDATCEPMFIPQAGMDALRSVALLLDLAFVVFQNLVDDRNKWIQLWPRRHFPAPVPGRNRVLQNLRDRLAINPEKPRRLTPAHTINMARTAYPIIKFHRIHLPTRRSLPRA